LRDLDAVAAAERPGFAVSLGGVESLIEQPARMTHCTTAGSPFGVDDSLLRLSVSLEDCDDLDHALDKP
jgi:cystathionine gamma-synthase